jgi:hypothetical protein
MLVLWTLVYAKFAEAQCPLHIYTQDIKFSDAKGIQDCGFKGRPITKPEETLSLHLCMPFLLVYRMNPMA